jgi:hypothetical protein
LGKSPEQQDQILKEMDEDKARALALMPQTASAGEQQQGGANADS